MIYCDMDGTLVEEVGEHGKRAWLAEGKKLWKAISQYRPTVLTFGPIDKFEEAKAAKIVWCFEHLGPVEVIVAKKSLTRKGGFAKKGDILIDNNIRNKKGWVESGGTFLLWNNNSQEVIKQVEDLMHLQNTDKCI